MAAEDDFTSLSALAERLGLEDKERDSFVNSSMQRLGYKPRMSWDEPEEGDGDGGGSGDFFSGKREQRRQREVPQGGNRQQRQQPYGY